MKLSAIYLKADVCAWAGRPQPLFLCFLWCDTSSSHGDETNWEQYLGIWRLRSHRLLCSSLTLGPWRFFSSPGLSGLIWKWVAGPPLHRPCYILWYSDPGSGPALKPLRKELCDTWVWGIKLFSAWVSFWLDCCCASAVPLEQAFRRERKEGKVTCLCSKKEREQSAMWWEVWIWLAHSHLWSTKRHFPWIVWVNMMNEAIWLSRMKLASRCSLYFILPNGCNQKSHHHLWKVGASDVATLRSSCVSAARLKTPHLPWSLQEIESMEGVSKEVPTNSKTTDHFVNAVTGSCFNFLL